MRMYLTLKKEFLDFQLAELEAEVRRIQIRQIINFLKSNFFNIVTILIILSVIVWFLIKDPIPIVSQSWETKEYVSVDIGSRTITDSGEIESFLKNNRTYVHEWAP